jgi:2'-5' RNA ligase
MRKIRCFLAVEIESVVTTAANELIRQMAPVGPGVRWVEPENMHLTFHFFGEVGETATYEICKAVRGVTRQFDPFGVTFAGTGAFPDDARPRILWTGVTEGREPLCELQGEIDAALRSIGYPTESRQYKPHLTLGRVREKIDQPALTASIQEWKQHELGQSYVEEVILFSSELRKSGPIYTRIGTSPLGE